MAATKTAAKKKPGRPRKPAPKEVVSVEQQQGWSDQERARIVAEVAAAQGREGVLGAEVLSAERPSDSTSAPSTQHFGTSGPSTQHPAPSTLPEGLRPAPAEAARAAKTPTATLSEQVTSYLDTRDSEAWGAAVDNRLRAEEEARRDDARERRRERAERPRTDMPPGAQAMLVAEQDRKREMRERSMPTARRADGSRLPVEHALRAPMKTSRRYTMPDATRIDPSLIKRDENGLSFVPQWVPVEDSLGQGERSWNHVETMIAFGGEVIKKKDGQALVSRFGVAMQQPPEDYANMTHQQAPTGVFDLDTLLEPVMGAQRDIDRKRGGVSRVWTEPEHGTRRRARDLSEQNEEYFAEDFDDD
jgi:hypothetical protein